MEANLCSLFLFIIIYICIAVEDPIVKVGRIWEPINRFNSITCLCWFKS